MVKINILSPSLPDSEPMYDNQKEIDIKVGYNKGPRRELPTITLLGKPKEPSSDLNPAACRNLNCSGMLVHV